MKPCFMTGADWWPLLATGFGTLRFLSQDEFDMRRLQRNMWENLQFFLIHIIFHRWTHIEPLNTRCESLPPLPVESSQTIQDFTQIPEFGFSYRSYRTYPLVIWHIYEQIHHFSWENSLFLWPFWIAMLDCQRVSQVIINLWLWLSINGQFQSLFWHHQRVTIIINPY